MSKRAFRILWILGGLTACKDSVAPQRDLFGDIIALQISAGLGQQVYSVDSSAKFVYSVRNKLPREVVIYGPGCLVTLELQNLQGITVFPTGARPCLPPLETFRVQARDSVTGTIALSGARGNPSYIGIFALPSGTFRMRIVIQGVTDLRTYNPVFLPSAWSAPFAVSP